VKESDKSLIQPLMMRRDYDSHTEEPKDASMMKKIAPIDYDDLEVKRKECLTDYDNPQRCASHCLLCDR
jgi:hypothetical protein